MATTLNNLKERAADYAANCADALTTMREFKLGDRVRVKIADRDTYAVGAAEALDGKTGTIVGTSSEGARAVGIGEYLVEFDTPAPKWWAHQTPATAMHFDFDDLDLAHEGE